MNFAQAIAVHSQGENCTNGFQITSVFEFLIGADGYYTFWHHRANLGKLYAKKLRLALTL